LQDALHNLGVASTAAYIAANGKPHVLALATIALEKLTEYVLNTRHKRGGTKARLLAQFGYTVQNWRRLEADIRNGLDTEVDLMRPTEYGTRYEIRMALQTPRGVLLTVRTIWQIDNEREVPRLITLYPD
jgi:hypothetical protein